MTIFVHTRSYSLLSLLVGRTASLSLSSSEAIQSPRRGQSETSFVAVPRERDNAAQSTSVCLQHHNLNKKLPSQYKTRLLILIAPKWSANQRKRRRNSADCRTQLTATPSSRTDNLVADLCRCRYSVDSHEGMLVKSSRGSALL